MDKGGVGKAARGTSLATVVTGSCNPPVEIGKNGEATAFRDIWEERSKSKEWRR